MKITVDEHIVLEQLHLAEADQLFALIAGDREYLAEFLPWPNKTKTVSDTREFITLMLKKRQETVEYGYAIKFDGQVVGHVSLMHLSDDRPVEIGYWIVSRFSGKGITTSVAKALTDFALHTLKKDQVVIRADPKNIGSNKVAEKCGYQMVDVEVSGDKTLNVWRIS